MTASCPPLSLAMQTILDTLKNHMRICQQMARDARSKYLLYPACAWIVLHDHNQYPLPPSPEAANIHRTVVDAFGEDAWWAAKLTIHQYLAKIHSILARKPWMLQRPETAEINGVSFDNRERKESSKDVPFLSTWISTKALDGYDDKITRTVGSDYLHGYVIDDEDWDQAVRKLTTKAARRMEGVEVCFQLFKDIAEEISAVDDRYLKVANKGMLATSAADAWLDFKCPKT